MRREKSRHGLIFASTELWTHPNSFTVNKWDSRGRDKGNENTAVYHSKIHTLNHVTQIFVRLFRGTVEPGLDGTSASTHFDKPWSWSNVYQTNNHIGDDHSRTICGRRKRNQFHCLSKAPPEASPSQEITA